MWVFSTIGFFSVVKKDSDEVGTVTIRSRVREDLERLGDYIPSMSEINTGGSDYGYRATAPQAEYAEAIGKLAGEIDYSNFKDKIGEIDTWRSEVYSDVWAAAYGMQIRERRGPPDTGWKPRPFFPEEY